MATPQSGDETRDALERRAEILRALIRQENDVTNHRTTWLLVSQGIFFAAVPALLRVHWFPALVVSVVGIFTTLSIGHALGNSFESRLYLKRTWRERIEREGYRWEDFPPLDGGNPELHPVRWLFPWTFIPRVIVTAWLLLIAYGLWEHFCAS